MPTSEHHFDRMLITPAQAGQKYRSDTHIRHYPVIFQSKLPVMCILFGHPTIPWAMHRYPSAQVNPTLTTR
eukprot:763421-Hanusia_phi.AAC.6